MLRSLTTRAALASLILVSSRVSAFAAGPALRSLSRSTPALGVRAMTSRKSEDEWRTQLSPQQFRVLREKGTEMPGSSEFNKFYPEEGTFACVGCGTPLYKSTSKFDSGCGWPAFYEGLPNAIKEVPDADGMRVEIVCNSCGGHLGHVFKGEGFPTPTDERHCVNGICLKYEDAK
uniref:Peptide-methionine (R)-S-oxide reductase n=1 Tax=Hemiselmis andersenii TaxID=464988 RepID=A0A6U4V101_HEMAN|mmetsp:Transcript_7773/g.17842  ORF Transcript_7773/g.17842 Transcript_7773/m.17842 type:complete len:175 (-) Transcript_7773:305-829(-)